MGAPATGVRPSGLSARRRIHCSQSPSIGHFPPPSRILARVDRRPSSLRRICVLVLSLCLLHGVAAASAGTPYVDGISDQSLPAWEGSFSDGSFSDGSFSDGSFSSFFDAAWVGQITLARYVLQWNAMAQVGDGPSAHGGYREQFQAWLRDIRGLGLAPVLALTSYTGVYPGSAGEYRQQLEAILDQAARSGEPIAYVEAWNEPNNQGEETAGKAGEIANWANSVCESRRCQVIAGDLEDTPSVATYEQAYIGALDFEPTIWGIHPYYAVKAHNDGSVLHFEQALPNHGAGAQLWFTEVGAYYCARGEVLGEARQASDASYLADTLIPAIAPVHVFYYGFMAAHGSEVPCTTSGGDDTELYRADGKPRAAADVLLSADAERTLLLTANLGSGSLLSSATP
jgi:hypothetical protein